MHAARRVLPLLLLLCEQQQLCWAQSATIDWSQVGVDADGTLEPTVVGVSEGEPPPLLEDLLGYYKNMDGFYGRPDHTEYLIVRHNDIEGLIEAVKLVGDHNVPRGKLTWRTERGQADAPAWRMAISLQLRDDISDDNAFWWSPHEHEVEWEPDSLDSFYIWGNRPGVAHRASFYRVTAAEAHRAAQTLEDAP